MNGDNSTDSPTGEECIICYHKFEDMPYAIINDNIQIKYHVHCLEEWIKKSDHDIITSNRIESYSIYHVDTLIEKIMNNTNYETNKDHLNESDNATEMTLLIPNDEFYDTESSTDEEVPCYTQYTKGQMICTGIALCFMVLLIIISYFFNK